MVGEVLNDGVWLRHGQQDARPASDALLQVSVVEQVHQAFGILAGELD